MKKIPFILSIALIIGLIAGCAKEDVNDLMNEDSSSVSDLPNLKITSGPVIFEDMFTVELISADILEGTSVFVYEFIPGTAPESEFLIAVAACKDTEVTGTAIYGSGAPVNLLIGTESSVKKYRRLKEIIWLKLSDLPTSGEPFSVEISLEGNWSVKDGLGLAIRGRDLVQEVLPIPECKVFDLPRVTTLGYTEKINSQGLVNLTIEGQILYPGLPEYYAYGIMYSTSGVPAVDDPINDFSNIILIDGKSTQETFFVEFPNIDPSETYYIRAIAVNEFDAYGTELHGLPLGIGPGEVFVYPEPDISIVNGPVLIDERIGGNGYTYHSVEIGNFYWLTENMHYLPYVNPQWKKGPPGIFVYGYTGDDEEIAMQTDAYDKYGVLYTWEAAIEACPDPWRLPSDAEWMDLERALGMETTYDQIGWRPEGNVGEALKTTSGWIWDTNDMAFVGTNSSGFSAVPSGYGSAYKDQENFSFEGSGARYWSSTDDRDNAYSRWLWVYDQDVSRDLSPKRLGFSVRCVLDVSDDGSN